MGTTMPRITKPLTNTEIEKAKPKEKEYILSDGGGLLLRISTKGAKTWYYNYYHPITKKRTKFSFGGYPAVSLSKAREKQLKAKELLSDNIDPKERQAELLQAELDKSKNTMFGVSEDWFEIKRKTISPDYADDVWSSLNNHIFESLGSKPISSITARETIDIMRPLAAKGSLETVRRLCQRLNEIMTFAVNTGVINSNSLAGIKAAFEPPKKKNMPTIRPEELSDFMSALQKAGQFPTSIILSQ